MLARLAGFLRGVGYLLGTDGLYFLPLYSPELNPIEPVWKLTRQLCLHNVTSPKLISYAQLLSNGLTNGAPGAVRSHALKKSIPCVYRTTAAEMVMPTRTD